MGDREDSIAGAGAPTTPPKADATIPVPGELVWSTDHESGTWTDWALGGPNSGGQYQWGDVTLSVAEGAGRKNSRGLVLTIDTSFLGEPSQGVRFHRRIEDAPAYYTAWFRIGEAHTVSDWWSIALFQGQGLTDAPDSGASLWDVRVVDTPSGEMALQFFDLGTMQGTIDQRLGRLAPGQWFELTLYLDYRPPNATTLRISVDGLLLFDVNSLRSAPATSVSWAVGNGANGLTPVASTLYVDDASIRRAAGAP